jgi:hypothetical protein
VRIYPKKYTHTQRIIAFWKREDDDAIHSPKEEEEEEEELERRARF